MTSSALMYSSAGWWGSSSKKDNSVCHKLLCRLSQSPSLLISGSGSAPQQEALAQCLAHFAFPLIMRRSIGHFRVPKTLIFKMRLGAQSFLWKWVSFAREWKMISISKAEHLLSFGNRGPGKLGHGLFESSTSPPGKPLALTITSFASKDWGPFLTISSWGGEFEFSFLVRSAPDNVIRQMRPSSWRNRKKYIGQEFLGRVSGKFPGPTGNIWKGSPVFPDGMFQTEMRVPLVKSHLWYQFQAFAAVFR